MKNPLVLHKKAVREIRINPVLREFNL